MLELCAVAEQPANKRCATEEGHALVIKCARVSVVASYVKRHTVIGLELGVDGRARGAVAIELIHPVGIEAHLNHAIGLYEG